MDDLVLCEICGDQEHPSSWGMCHSCRTQKQIDENDWTPVCCPNCKSSLVIQHDWRYPIYRCELCGTTFEDPEGTTYISDP